MPVQRENANDDAVVEVCKVMTIFVRTVVYTRTLIVQTPSLRRRVRTERLPVLLALIELENDLLVDFERRVDGVLRNVVAA